MINGGEGGIRTLDTLLTYTPLAGERLQPLGHFSEYSPIVLLFWTTVTAISFDCAPRTEIITNDPATLAVLVC